MEDRPLSRPEHLRDVASARGAWLVQRPFAVAAAVLGVIGFVVVSATQTKFWAAPDWRVSVPAFAVTAAASLVSIARREKGHAVWLIGIGFAGAALVLGWFMMLALVIGVTLLLMLIVHSVM